MSKFPNLALTEEVIVFHVADSSILMQQVCLLSSWDIGPCGVVTKDYGEDTLFPWVDRGQRD